MAFEPVPVPEPLPNSAQGSKGAFVDQAGDIEVVALIKFPTFGTVTQARKLLEDILADLRTLTHTHDPSRPQVEVVYWTWGPVPSLDVSISFEQKEKTHASPTPTPQQPAPKVWGQGDTERPLF